MIKVSYSKNVGIKMFESKCSNQAVQVVKNQLII
jgi:hypothetical protein